MEKLYEKYKDKGFEILNFPSNQFLKQAPEPNEEIAKICQLKYGTTFKTFAKIDVNGKDAAPLYVYLKEKGKEEIENRESLSFKDRIAKLGNSILGSDVEITTRPKKVTDYRVKENSLKLRVPMIIK